MKEQTVTKSKNPKDNFLVTRKLCCSHIDFTSPITTTQDPTTVSHNYSTYLEYPEAIKNTCPGYEDLRTYLDENRHRLLTSTDWSISI